MLSFKTKYLIEMASIFVLILILVYLPNNARLVLKSIFITTAPHYSVKTIDCDNIKIVKHFHPLNGEMWTIIDSECLSLNANDLITYKQHFLGKVVGKSGEYSVVMPVYNRDVKLKVKLKTRENKIVEGVYRGMGGNVGMVFYIPAQLNIEIGTPVYTILDNQNKLPENLIVGYVKEQQIEPNQTMTLIIAIDIDLETLSTKYINIYKLM